MEPIRIVVEYYLDTTIEVGIDFAVVIVFSLLITILFPKALTERKDTIGAIVSSALLIICVIVCLGDTLGENLYLTIFYTLSLICFFLLFMYLILTAWNRKESQQSKL